MAWFLSQSSNFSIFVLIYVYLYLTAADISGNHLTDNPAPSKISNTCHTELVIHRNSKDKIAHKPMTQLLVNTSITNGVCVFVR